MRIRKRDTLALHDDQHLEWCLEWNRLGVYGFGIYKDRVYIHKNGMEPHQDRPKVEL